MRRLVVAAVIVLAVGSLVGIALYRQQHAAARRLAIWEAQREEDAIPAVYWQTFDWEHGDLALEEFAKLVTAKTGLAADVDDDTRRARLRQEKVQVPAGSFSLEALLPIVLAPRILKADWRGEKLVFTAELNFTERTRRRTVVHPLPLPQRQGLDDHEWAALIQANIQGHVAASAGAVIVVAGREEQRRARQVIEAVRALNEPTPEPVAIAPAAIGAAEQRILAALEAPASLDTIELPLRDVVRYLSEAHNIPILLLADKLEGASVSTDTPITKSLNDLSLRSVLRLMLRDLELTYVVRDQALFITTPEDAESRPRTLAYPVHDVIADAKGSTNAEAISGLISSTIAADSWKMVGGIGKSWPNVADEWLIIQQTDEVHEQIRDLLSTLRRMLAKDGNAGGQPIIPPSELTQKIHAALSHAIEVDFAETPLKDVCSYFADTLQIPIVLSVKKLDEASVSMDTPVTITLPSQPARIQLESLLGKLQLDFVVRDEVLQITTPEDTENQLETRIYDTRELLAGHMDDEQLRRTICSGVQPSSWFDISGGPGTATVFRGLLVVTQTQRVHEQLQRFLESLQKENQH